MSGRHVRSCILDLGLPGSTPLVLVHGAGANGVWWDQTVPGLLRQGFGPIIAPDLSGHGDSGWRNDYRLDHWAAEANALSQMTCGMCSGPAPVLVGHSLGGLVALERSSRGAGSWGGVVVIDSPVGRSLRSVAAGRRRSLASGASPAYPDLVTATNRFRLLPDDHDLEPEVRRRLAEHSLRLSADGTWRWKVDPRIFERTDGSDSFGWSNIVEATEGRVAFLYAEESSVVDVEVASNARRALTAARVRAASRGHHHLILEIPELVASEISEEILALTASLHLAGL